MLLIKCEKCDKTEYNEKRHVNNVLFYIQSTIYFMLLFVSLQSLEESQKK